MTKRKAKTVKSKEQFAEICRNACNALCPKFVGTYRTQLRRKVEQLPWKERKAKELQSKRDYFEKFISNIRRKLNKSSNTLEISKKEILEKMGVAIFELLVEMKQQPGGYGRRTLIEDIAKQEAKDYFHACKEIASKKNVSMKQFANSFHEALIELIDKEEENKAYEAQRKSKRRRINDPVVVVEPPVEEVKEEEGQEEFGGFVDNILNIDLEGPSDQFLELFEENPQLKPLLVDSCCGSDRPMITESDSETQTHLEINQVDTQTYSQEFQVDATTETIAPESVHFATQADGPDQITLETQTSPEDHQAEFGTQTLPKPDSISFATQSDEPVLHNFETQTTPEEYSVSSDTQTESLIVHAHSDTQTETSPVISLETQTDSQESELMTSDTQTEPLPVISLETQTDSQALDLMSSDTQTEPLPVITFETQTDAHDMISSDTQTTPPPVISLEIQTDAHEPELITSDSQTEPPAQVNFASQTYASEKICVCSLIHQTKSSITVEPAKMSIEMKQDLSNEQSPPKAGLNMQAETSLEETTDLEECMHIFKGTSVIQKTVAKQEAHCKGRESSFGSFDFVESEDTYDVRIQSSPENTSKASPKRFNVQTLLNEELNSEEHPRQAFEMGHGPCVRVDKTTSCDVNAGRNSSGSENSEELNFAKQFPAAESSQIFSGVKEKSFDYASFQKTVSGPNSLSNSYQLDPHELMKSPLFPQPAASRAPTTVPSNIQQSLLRQMLSKVDVSKFKQGASASETSSPALSPLESLAAIQPVPTPKLDESIPVKPKRTYRKRNCNTSEEPHAPKQRKSRAKAPVLEDVLENQRKPTQSRNAVPSIPEASNPQIVTPQPIKYPQLPQPVLQQQNNSTYDVPSIPNPQFLQMKFLQALNQYPPPVQQQPQFPTPSVPALNTTPLYPINYSMLPPSTFPMALNPAQLSIPNLNLIWNQMFLPK